MSDIQVTALAQTRKTGMWFQRNRYTTALFINEVPTGLHVHHRRKDALEVQEWLVDNSQKLLWEEGLYEKFYRMFATEEAGGLPQVGDSVELAVKLGIYEVGTKGKITAVDAEDESFPVTFAPDAQPQLAFPLATSEWKVSA